MEYELINIIFALIVPISIAVWLIFAYWQIKLLSRINVVSRTQHQIPENVSILKRMRIAIEADSISQHLVKKRNYWAAIFLFFIVLTGTLMAITVLIEN